VIEYTKGEESVPAEGETMTAQRRGKTKKLPEFLTEEEMTALIRVPNPRYPTGERNRLLMIVMLDAGLRLSEAIHLRWRDLDLNTGRLMIREGKGSKDRTVWLGTDAVDLVRSWRQRQANTFGGAVDLVFTTLDGKALQPRYVQAMVERYGVRAGIEKHCHPHLLRHTYATSFYRETHNLRSLQLNLGHNDLTTTSIYTHVVDTEREAESRSFRHAAALVGATA